MSEKVGNQEKNGLLLTLLKGVIIAIFVSLIGVLVFAFLIKIFGIGSRAINPVNQVIKGISIFIGVFFALKKQDNKLWIKGLLVGTIYCFASFFLFSILDGAFNFNYTILTDLIFLSIMGLISGTIISFFKKNQK